MLRVSDVCKQYKTGSFVQTALNHVSLNLRDNEFVAILGPSGSGKTTLLNIIGGLDRYDSGDLIINNISTKKYRDRDWDSYRNHTIGFVFQSYNLIPHQTILANVELALTISGLTKKQRRGKAQAALEKVGLGQQGHKKPNQLSGGQMQRVAIARALVNDPDILLADEPTGALDSDTSVQVMDLLKEVAEDRLVVMVTHNPELAYQYATRIVTLKDGCIVSDTDPYEVDEAAAAVPVVHQKMGHAGMNWLTAIQLSFNNLLTKKARTLLVAFAGSIGIIGIALIMSLSNGANDYIKTTEEKTLSEYPLEITKSAFDMTSLLQVQSDILNDTDDGKIHERQVASGMFGTVQENDLKSLKAYLDSGESGVEDDVNAIEYSYDITPYIYRINDSGEARQVSPDTIMTSLGFSSSLSSLFSSSSSYMSVFNPLPADPALYQDQYEVVAGHWPENSHELVVVLTGSNGLTDLCLYSLGLKDPTELDSMLSAYQNGSTDTDIEVGNPGSWDYSEVLGLEFKLLESDTMYSYDEEHGVWVSETGSQNKLNALAEGGKTLTITGIVRQKDEDTTALLSTGVCYPASLITEIMENAQKSEIVQAQLADTSTNVLTGKSFDDENSDFDIASLFSIDEDTLSDMFSFDMDSFSLDEDSLSDIDLNLDLGSMDLSSMIDPNAFSGIMSGLNSDTLNQIFNGVKINITEENVSELAKNLYDGFSASAAEDPRTDISGLSAAVNNYFQTEEAKQILKDAVSSVISENGEAVLLSDAVQSAALELLTGYEEYVAANNLPAEDTQANIEAYLASESAQNVKNTFSESAVSILKDALSSDGAVGTMLEGLTNGYAAYADANNEPVPSEIGQAFVEYLSSEEAKAMLTKAAEDMIDTNQLQANLNSVITNLGTQAAAAIGAQISSAMTQVSSQIAAQLEASISNMMTQYMDKLSSSFTFSPDSLEGLISTSMSADNMQEMLLSMFSGTTSTAADNLTDFGYADENDPESITFYPIDFDCKTNVVNMLNDYNTRMEDAGEDDKVITFTDIVGSLMSSVTTIVNIIGYVLIAFVAISLVVSSIMIGVITYISVLERRKEIGILRAMGASKHNITEVFNAETIITGFLAGLLGVLITYLLLIPGNAILQHATGQQDLHAFLPVSSAALLVLLSVILTTLGGFIPSKGAAKQDPVLALRSE